MEFVCSMHKNDDVLRLSLQGVIDEDVELPRIETEKIRLIEFDLKGVKGINSIGIREWMEWVRRLASVPEIEFHHCPKAMVSQFNMVEGFLPANAKVKSFYLPFFCEKCDQTSAVLLEVGKSVLAQGEDVEVDPKVRASSSCGEANCEMEIDVIEAKYFKFLKAR